MMSPYAAKKTKYKNHPIPMVGRVWVFPEVTYTQDPEGELGISLAELGKLQLAVANAICGEDSPLKSDELDLLMSLSRATVAELAELLRCHGSNIGKWRNKEQAPPLESLVLKEYFWMKLFSGKVDFPKGFFGKDRLEKMTRAAIASQAATAVSKKVA